MHNPVARMAAQLRRLALVKGLKHITEDVHELEANRNLVAGLRVDVLGSVDNNRSDCMKETSPADTGSKLGCSLNKPIVIIHCRIFHQHWLSQARKKPQATTYLITCDNGAADPLQASGSAP